MKLYLVLFKWFGLSNIGIDALMTLLIVVALILLVYLVASVMSFHYIEMIENWAIGNYRQRRDTKQGSFF